MASFFTLTLDTTGPQGVSIVLNSGATFASTREVTATLATTDGTTTGYQMKLWGDVDPTVNTSIQALEASSAWIAFNASQAVTLSNIDGFKTVNVKIRDDVFNESAVASDSITLDTTVPVITLSAPDVTRVSKVAGKRVASATFSTDTALVAYEVRVVPSQSSLQSSGTVIPTTNGSTNMSGGAVAANATVNITIDGRDLELASAGDGNKIVKVFGQEASGAWSV